MARAQLRACKVCKCPAVLVSEVTRDTVIEHRVVDGAILVTPHYVTCSARG